LWNRIVDRETRKYQRPEAILETIQDQALLNFELELREDIKLVVQYNHKYSNLQEAINAASAKETCKRAYRANNNDCNKYGQSQKSKNLNYSAEK